MVVSVNGAIITFIIGGGLIWLGAFFIWRLVYCHRGLSLTLPILLPVGAVILMTCILGMTEIISGLFWGTVVINLGLIGIIGLCFGARISWHENLLAILWLAFAWLMCSFAGYQGNLGRFSGLGLVLVGEIAVWQNIKTEKISLGCACGWQWWVKLLFVILLLLLGAWLVVWCQPVVAVTCGLPVTVFSAVVLAPICSMTTLLGLRNHGKWQPEKVLSGLTWGNVILTTAGLGLVTVLIGGLHLVQSTVAVILPWAAGLEVLSIVVTVSPQKTARWWSGLMVVMYCAYLFSLLW
ncbi:MAG: hypothetical protein MJ060_01670 [Clostridia bacterium]|nr:hypothetical protein [Clostridia bacterium]